MRREFLPLEFKYSPDQPRDDNGRFASGGGGGRSGGSSGGGRSVGGGVRSTLLNLVQSSGHGGVHTAAKILGATIVIAGGVSHFQAYVRRLERVAAAATIHEAIGLALSPVRRRKSADAMTGNLDRLLDHVESLTEEEARHLLREVIAMMPAADAEFYLDGLRREGLVS